MSPVTPPEPSRLERILAVMVAGIVGMSIVAFLAIIIGSWQGMTSEDFSAGIWPTVSFVPLIGLPIGFLLILALLVVNTRRRRAGEAEDNAS